MQSHLKEKSKKDDLSPKLDAQDASRLNQFKMHDSCFSFGQPQSQESLSECPDLIQPGPQSGFEFSKLSIERPQAKLNISQPGDPYEVEADRVAEEVTKAGIEKEDIRPSVFHIARKALDDSTPITENVPSVPHEITNSCGRPLDSSVRDLMEPRFGADFSQVRIHDNQPANEAAKSLNARAFTVGTDVVFDSGQYMPNTDSGLRLIAHELTHVVQQGAGNVKNEAPPENFVSASLDNGQQPADKAAVAVESGVMHGEHATGQSSGALVKVDGRADSVIQRQQASASTMSTAVTSTTAGPAADVARPATEIADDFEVDALLYFNENMEMELRTATSVEGAAIGRHAAQTAGGMVRDVCEPYESDQELDTNIMNTIFSIASGGASVTEAGTSGTATGAAQNLGSRGANVGSRIVRAGLGILQVWMPTLAGYRTVGQLKDAAIRNLGEGAEKSGETNSPEFQDYENEVMTSLREDWKEEVKQLKAKIEDSENPEVAAGIARLYFSTQRDLYLNKLRKDYGSQSSHASAMASAITSTLRPKLGILGESLESAKTSRQRWQALGALGAGVAGGAAIGAGIGVWGLGVTAIPGALIGGAVGFVVGGVAALGILFD